MRVLAAQRFEDAPRVRGARVACEWRAERDHAARVVGQFLRHLAGVQAAEAPADQADRLAVSLGERTNVGGTALEHAVARAEVEALAPGLGGVAEVVEEAA